MRILVAVCLAALAVSCGAPQGEPAPAQTPAAAITIEGAYVTPTPPGVSVSGGYLAITNAQSSDDALTALSTARAERAEVHEMAMEDGVMRMRAVESLPIPAGQTVTLAPGGLHLMFYDMATPFAEGETIDVTLHFAQAGDVVVSMPVRPRSSGHSGH